MYVAQKKVVRAAGKYLSMALPFYLVNSLIAAMIVFLWGKPFFEVKVAYAVVCLLSLFLLLITRKMLEDYAFDSFEKWSIVVGVLGFVTGLVAGGALVLIARSKLLSELSS